MKIEVYQKRHEPLTVLRFSSMCEHFIPPESHQWLLVLSSSEIHECQILLKISWPLYHIDSLIITLWEMKRCLSGITSHCLNLTKPTISRVKLQSGGGLGSEASVFLVLLSQDSWDNFLTFQHTSWTWDF